jgi:hypothetical protein
MATRASDNARGSILSKTSSRGTPGESATKLQYGDSVIEFRGMEEIVDEDIRKVEAIYVMWIASRGSLHLYSVA